MATHINTTNAIKGLTCAIEHFKGIEHVVHISTQHPIQHLTNAATEIERLNSEAIKLRGEISKLKENTITAMRAQTESYRKRWNTIIETIAATDVGRGLLHRGMDIDIVTDKAVAVINKTASDLKEALRTAEAFQKAQLESEKKRDVNLGWFNIESFEVINYALYGRLPGKTTRTNYEIISHEIIDEAVRASEIHPKWPTDALHAVSILTEESGELMKAAIEYHYNNGDIEAVREEAVQTGAMALRVLLNIDKYKRPSDEK
ncbi:TPA: hypothetical protein ACJS4S_004089 [Yersinia enterocolitica]|uniref:hypothetical protein n=1 Tax=Yersinia enterocolitica TaxID=630 RepID=UPI0005E844F1|nr:hypothetical protein [Yersinia enterocolitica]CNJ74580.1 bacteriophage protein [Yersinia enterocolitica]HDL6527628.1 hypothetical protein [Yersinia enterocolitica]HDL6731015.1 hypothetical protein [Yersinia enterocolitica]HEA9933611.1 hypothetical protein [Yersinia enterocolitica]HEN3367048.1 hypothetical protein [Yersinia enterocolitica]